MIIQRVLRFAFDQAQKAGVFKDEIIPIEIRGKVITQDDTIRPGVTAESLSKLKPVFPDWGASLTTAGNASGLGDGAAICILTTRERAHKEGFPILGKWVGSSVVGETQAISMRAEPPHNAKRRRS